MIATIADPQTEARTILLGTAPGIVDQHVLWAVGAHFAWRAAHLASAWDRRLIVDSEHAGSTLSDGRRWRSLTANRRQAVLVDRRGHQVFTVRLADVIPLVDQARLPADLVTAVRDVLAERQAVSRAEMAASQRYILTGRYDLDGVGLTSAAVERRCRQLAAQAWGHVRPADTLFDLVAG